MMNEETKLTRKLKIQKEILTKLLKRLTDQMQLGLSEVVQNSEDSTINQKKQKMKKKTTIRMRLLIMSLLSSMLYFNGWSQEWQPTNGPFGGCVTSFTGNSEYVFLGEGLGIYASGIFRSADNGLTWEKVNNGLGTGQGNYTIAALGTANNWVVAATGKGIYRSDNNGNNWSLCSYPAGNYVPNVIVFDGTTIYGGGVSGLFASDDNGLTWSARGNFPGFTYPAFPEIQSMAVTSQYVYAGTAYAGVFRSSDGGYTWESLNDGIGEPWMIEYLAFTGMATSGNDVIVASPELGIFRLTDNGSVWVEENSGFPAGNSGNIRLIVNGQYAYTGTSVGLFKSSLSGTLSWEAANGNMPANFIRCLYGNGTAIFAGINNDGVYRSIDESTTWQPVNEGMQGIIIRRIVKTGDNQLTATSYFGSPFFTSNNSGSSWSQGNHSVEVGPVVHNNFQFITYNMELFRSADNGSNWELMSNAWNALPAYTMFSKGDTLFSGGSLPNGIAYSVNNGVSFQAVSGIYNPNGGWPTVYCIENIGSNMFAGTRFGMFRSVDNGLNWISCYPAFDNILINDLEVMGDTLFAGASSGVYMSTDLGITWTPAGLTSKAINVLKYNEGVLFAGTALNGIFFTTNAGEDWIQYNEGLPDGSLNIGSIEVLNDTLYTGVFANYGLPVFKRPFQNSAPALPSPIVGPVTPCIGISATYTVDNVSGVFYSWQVPAGWIILSGNSTNSITVEVGSSGGIILVTPSNSFGTGLAQYLNVTPTSSAPAQPGQITGPEAPAVNTEVQYSVAPEIGVTYNWTLPEGWTILSGENTNIILVLVGESNGQITVTATSPCGTSEPSILVVNPVNPDYPLVFDVTGGGDYCEDSSGLPVGLSGSQIGVIYTLYKDGVPQSPTITGTGEPITFGDQTEGAYTVFANNGINNVQMNGTAVLTAVIIAQVTVTIEVDNNVLCAGAQATLTAIPQNGGTPDYQWYVNHSPAGTNQASFTYSPNDGDEVYVLMTSSLSCTTENPVSSNVITFTVEQSVTPAVSIVASENPVIAGTAVTFTAQPTYGGSNPLYLWFVNGVNVGSESSYTYVPVNGDQVYVIMTTSMECAVVPTVISNTIIVEVITGTAPDIKESLNISSIDNKIIIDDNQAMFGKVKIFSITGQLLLEYVLAGETKVEIPVNTGSGIYLVKIIQSDKQLNAKVFIR